MSIAHKSKAAFSHVELCKAGTNQPKTWDLFDYLFGSWLDGTGKAFPHGNFDMIDEKNPSLKNTISVDKTLNDDLFTRNLKNKRELYRRAFIGNTSEDGKVEQIDRVKRYATEGAVLTFLGKIIYDVEKDQFTFTDGIGIAGSGYEDCLSMAKVNYDFWMIPTVIFLGFGGVLLCAGVLNGVASFLGGSKAPKAPKCASCNKNASVVFTPCNHFSSCKGCNKNGKCPLKDCQKSKT